MLLFSNPHPYSVHQGMFLSPNSNGQENLFWPVMEGAGWLPIPAGDRNPKLLADICLNMIYQGPFDFIFYCYYAFPTDFPEHIKRIFGRKYFSQFIEPEAADEFRKVVQEVGVDAVAQDFREVGDFAVGAVTRAGGRWRGRRFGVAGGGVGGGGVGMEVEDLGFGILVLGEWVHKKKGSVSYR